MVINDHTIRLNLSSWDNRILSDLMMPVSFMISPTAYEKKGAEWILTNPVGTGPFVFKENKGNQILIFEKNKDYWRKGLPYMDRVELHSIPDAMVAFAALQAGEIDIMTSLDIAQAARASKDPNLVLRLGNTDLGGMIFMNTTDPDSVWSDVRMRQAFEYALDKETLAGMFSIYAEPIYNVIKCLEVTQKENITPRKYNPGRAKELMAEAGYPNGLTFKLNILAPALQFVFKNSCLAMQQQLAEVGLKMEFAPLERAMMAEVLMTPLSENSVTQDAMEGSSTNPIEFVIQTLAEDSGKLVSVKRPDGWDDLLEKALQTEDPQESLDLLVQMDEMAYKDAMIIPLTTNTLPDYHNKRVHDISWGMKGWKGFELAAAWLSE